MVLSDPAAGNLEAHTSTTDVLATRREAIRRGDSIRRLLQRLLLLGILAGGKAVGHRRGPGRSRRSERRLRLARGSLGFCFFFGGGPVLGGGVAICFFERLKTRTAASSFCWAFGLTALTALARQDLRFLKARTTTALSPHGFLRRPVLCREPIGRCQTWAERTS